jgi:hypothetical protein
MLNETDIQMKNETDNGTTPALADVLSYVKEKLSIVEKEQSNSYKSDELTMQEYIMHTEFLSGLWNAYEDVRFVLEEGSFKHTNSNKA